jgi:leader peptidase (prepilin peptidase)/N-methyltransferase
MGEGDAKLLLMIGAFLGWQSVLFVLVAGSIQGLLAAGLAMVFGVPLIPKRPDELESDSTGIQEQSDPTVAPSPAAESSSAIESTAAEGEPSGPPMMVFGPMLAISALEYLFFGQQMASWIADHLAP